jgi:hypothetical protein
MVRISPLATAVCAMVALGCAHGSDAERTGPATLAGHLGNLRFDPGSVTGPSVSMSRGTDGHWRGTRICPAGDPCPAEVFVGEESIEVQGRRFDLSFTDRVAVVHEALVDIVLRRADGGPVPRALVVPIWIAYELAPGNRVAPEGRCLDVDGLGTVQLIVLPAGVSTVDIEVHDGCSFRFLERVTREELDRAPGTPGSPST